VSDRGSAPLELALGAVVILVPVVLVVLSLAPWLERQLAARVLAREAARVMVLADTYEEGAERAAALVDEVATNYGIATDDLSLRLEGDLVRGGAITSFVTVRVPVLGVPGIGSVVGPVWQWSTRHVEQVDLYRSLP